MSQISGHKFTSDSSAQAVDAITRLAADLVLAFVANNSVSSNDLPDLLRRLREELARPMDLGASKSNLNLIAAAPSLVQSELATLKSSPAAKAANRTNEAPPHPSGPEPAVPVEQSVSEEYIICLEDGGRYRTLKRHLAARYGLTPDEYRRKWRLPADYPMVAPEYAKQRADAARRIGLGGKTTPKRTDGVPAKAAKSKASGRRS